MKINYNNLETQYSRKYLGLEDGSEKFGMLYNEQLGDSHRSFSVVKNRVIS